MCTGGVVYGGAKDQAAHRFFLLPKSMRSHVLDRGGQPPNTDSNRRHAMYSS